MSNIPPEVEVILTQANVLVSAEPLPDYRLRLTYRDGTVYVLDFKPVIAKGGVIAELADPAVFAAVKIGERGRSLEFPGEIDFCADALRVDAEAQARGIVLADE